MVNEPIFVFKLEVERHIVKKNNRPILSRGKYGSPFIGKSKDLLNMEAFINLHMVEANTFQTPIDFPIHLKLLFHFPHNVYYTQKNTINKKLPDLSNLIELPQDALQKAGIIENDNLVHSLDGSRRLPGDKFLLEVFIYKHDD